MGQLGEGAVAEDQPGQAVAIKRFKWGRLLARRRAGLPLRIGYNALLEGHAVTILAWLPLCAEWPA